jgi:hypothetical protein
MQRIEASFPLEEARAIVSDDELVSPKRLNLRKTLKVAASAIWASHKHVRQGAPRPTPPCK